MTPTKAIRLSWKNVELISETLSIPRHEIQDELEEFHHTGEAVYYVRNPLYLTHRLPYLIYKERDFLTDFATVQSDIEDQFVPVTQIEVGP